MPGSNAAVRSGRRRGSGAAVEILAIPGLVSIDVSAKGAGEKGHDLLGVPDVLRDIHGAIELQLPVTSPSRWLKAARTAAGAGYYELK